jgi:Flp pilus assembly pilin Flp
MLRRLIADDAGQDLIEYALLSALIGVVCVLAWTNIRVAIKAGFEGWDGNVQTLSECTPDPGGGGC